MLVVSIAVLLIRNVKCDLRAFKIGQRRFRGSLVGVYQKHNLELS